MPAAPPGAMSAARSTEMTFSQSHFEAMKRDLREARRKLQAKREMQQQAHRDFPVTLAEPQKT